MDHIAAETAEVAAPAETIDAETTDTETIDAETIDAAPSLCTTADGPTSKMAKIEMKYQDLWTLDVFTKYSNFFFK